MKHRTYQRHEGQVGGHGAVEPLQAHPTDLSGGGELRVGFWEVVMGPADSGQNGVAFILLPSLGARCRLL